MVGVEDYWGINNREAPVDETTLNILEANLNISLPPLLREMYLIRNGGPLVDADEPEELMPIRSGGLVCESISSLQQWGEAEVLLDDDLEWIEEDVGALNLVLPFARCDHQVWALDYNRRSAHREPRVIVLDLECIDVEAVAGTFTEWIADLLGQDDEPAVDWESIAAIEQIHHETVMVVSAFEGSETTDQILCDSGNGKLVWFSRRETTDGVLELERAEMCNVDGDWLNITKVHAELFWLELQPADLSIAWTMSTRKKSGKWKNEQTTEGASVVTMMATRRTALEEVVRDLRARGFVSRK